MMAEPANRPGRKRRLASEAGCPDPPIRRSQAAAIADRTEPDPGPGKRA